MNIIITGASKGIGYQTVLHLAKNQEDHIIAISRDMNALEKLKNEVENINMAKLEIIGFDLAQKDYSSLTDKIIAYLSLDDGNSIEVLINNAGILVNKPFIETDESDWQRTFDVNVFSAIRLIKKLYPYFNRENGSHILNIGSMGGIPGTKKFPGLAAYCASKGTLNILTEMLATEFENEKIRVNSINPGGVNTEMFYSAFPGVKAPVQAEEMGEYIAHFATHAHKYMNGRLNQVSLK